MIRCFSQSAFWHSLPQYNTFLQPEHSINFPGAQSSRWQLAQIGRTRTIDNDKTMSSGIVLRGCRTLPQSIRFISLFEMLVSCLIARLISQHDKFFVGNSNSILSLLMPRIVTDRSCAITKIEKTLLEPSSCWQPYCWRLCRLLPLTAHRDIFKITATIQFIITDRLHHKINIKAYMVNARPQQNHSRTIATSRHKQTKTITQS